MTKFYFRRISLLSLVFSLVLSLTACFGNDGPTGKEKENKDTNKTISDEKWKIPTGVDPQY